MSFGMKEPKKRYNLCNGTNLNHALYDNWKLCVEDRMIYEALYLNDLSRTQYKRFLDKTYAKGKNYSGTLEKLIVKNDLKDYFNDNNQIMNKEFKKALIPYLFDGSYMVTYMLQNLPNWPQINMKEFFEDEEEFDEPLDTENCEFVDYTENTLIISCGGDWQEPHTLTIGFFEEMGYLKLGVIDVEKGGYSEGIDYDMFEALFWDMVEFIPKDVKSINQLRRELEAAVDDEDYELAAKLRDEIMMTIHDKA